MEAANKHCSTGTGIWGWANNDQDGKPDVITACCGDVPTIETRAAVDLLRQLAPELRMRVINVVDLMTYSHMKNILTLCRALILMRCSAQVFL